MKSIRFVMGAVILAGLAACSTPNIASRNAPFEALPTEGAVENAQPSDVVQVPSYTPRSTDFNVVDYEIKVPKSLKVSEANLFYPIADIVWRGDPLGDRKQQVGTIFQKSLMSALPKATGSRDVKAYIVVNRFHSLTEKTRYTVGGTHSISFYVTLQDVKTGEVLVNARKVKSDLKAFGGMRAIQAEAQGLDMKTRIHSHLTRVIAAELTLPNGWNEQDYKLNTAIDQI